MSEPAGADAEGSPRFTMPVAGGFRGMRAAPALLTGLTPEMNGRLREAFTPTRPKQQLNNLFIGRRATLRRIISAIEEERAHVILFGDRGRGKTSLANAVEEIARQAGYFALKATCSAEIGFEDIIRHFLKRIPATYYRRHQNGAFQARNALNTFDEILPERGFSVTELNDVLAGLHGTHALFILDEYDRVVDEEFRNTLAELMKNLTDGAIAVTLLVVGVAENLDQLLGKHPSIQRSLVPVHLPLMSDEDIGHLIEAGAQTAGIPFAPPVIARIADFARGLPYYAQLLGLHAARSAISRDAPQVGREDLAYAVNRCLQEAERGVVEACGRALADGELAIELRAAALCPDDSFGAFEVEAAVALGADGDRLAQLCEAGRGAILERAPEPGAKRYRFRNQMARQYLRMRFAVDDGEV